MPTSNEQIKHRVFNSAQKLGVWAEKISSELLQESGFLILEKNFHSRFGEIDLIAVKDQDLIFVEVKARSQTLHARAIETLTLSKQKKIFKTALIYLQNHAEFEQYHYRFDLFCFDFKNKRVNTEFLELNELDYDFEWIENAFTLNEDLINL